MKIYFVQRIKSAKVNITGHVTFKLLADSFWSSNKYTVVLKRTSMLIYLLHLYTK